jgi:hypothetical protein
MNRGGHWYQKDDGGAARRKLDEAAMWAAIYAYVRTPSPDAIRRVNEVVNGLAERARSEEREHWTHEW